jgi:hypothetical protein
MQRKLARIALALGVLGTSAAFAEVDYDPNYPDRSGVEVRTLSDGRVVERYYAPPAFIERDGRRYYYGEPGYDVRPYYDRRYENRTQWPTYDPLFPQQGQRVERGLFNRRGPNDFGS